MGKYREQPWEPSLIVNLVLRDETRCGTLDNAEQSGVWGCLKSPLVDLILRSRGERKYLTSHVLGMGQCFGEGGVIFVCLATGQNCKERYSSLVIMMTKNFSQGFQRLFMLG